MAKISKAQAHRVQVALQRAAYADRNYPRFRSMLLAALKRQVHEYAKSHSPKVSSATKHKWAAEFARVQRPVISHMVQHGWEIAAMEVGHASKRGKSADDALYRAPREQSYEAPKEPRYQSPIEPQYFGKRGEKSAHGSGPVKSGFNLDADMSRIDRWIKTTSVSASETSATRLENIFKNGAADARSPAEMAADILKAGLAQTEARANMLAHTGAIWSYNEGAMARYQDAGVAVVEWLTAEDDLACPFCAEMNGQRIQTGDDFFSAGDHLTVASKVLKIPGGSNGFSVAHPPLHPNCRCTILPVFGEDAAD